MIFGPVSSVKGNRCIIVALVLALTVGVVSGLGAFVVPSEAATPTETVTTPVLLYGVGDAVAAPETDDKHLPLRRREVAFDPEVLSDIALTKDVREATLDLFDDVMLTVDIEQVRDNLLDVISFSGRLMDQEHGYFLMTLDPEGRALLRADVLDDGLVYIVAEETASGGYVVSEHRAEDLRGIPSPVPERPQYDKELFPEPKLAPVVGDRPMIDVMVVYTPASEQWARINRTGINNVISQAMEQANVTLQNSDVDLHLRLVHAQQVPYTESDDYVSDLYNLTFHDDFPPEDLPEGLNPAEELVEVHDLRNEYGADLVVLMNLSEASASGFAGVAWLLLDPAGEPNWGFSVVSVEYADMVLIHEIGHNLGCHHSRNQMMEPAPPEGGLFEYSTGWRWRGLNNRRYASIMTYPEFDFDTFEWDTHLPLFSNPDINYAGVPTGSYTGEFAPADNARSIREIKEVIAGYRPREVPVDDEGEGEEPDPEPVNIWYVNVNSPYPQQDGSTWESPFRTINQALNVASAGDEIWVARGLYQEGAGDAPAVQMKNGVRMYGGFIGMEDSKFERDIFANITAIDGANERYAVVGADSVLDGFVIINGGMYNDDVSPVVRNCGFANNAVGMFNVNASPRVEDSIFQDNIDGMHNVGGAPRIRRVDFLDNLETALFNEDVDEVMVFSSSFINNRGGAMVNVNVELVDIEACLFNGNRAAEGGAIHSTDSTVSIVASTFVENSALEGDGGAIFGGRLAVDTVSFRRNTAVGDGGAVARSAGGSIIANARFTRNNVGGNGGALLISNDILVENCLIYGNSPGEEEDGAGISVESGAPEIWNTTFARNFGYALHNMTGAANSTLVNCIIWGNTNAILNENDGTAAVTFSVVQGGVEGQGNIDEDPLFRNIAQGDLYLLADSPCINAGTDEGAPDTDIVGTARPHEGGHDMGAWEYIGPEGGDAGEGPAVDPTEGEPEEGEGEEEEDVPAASFDVESRVRDREGLLPLHDWVPLFRFTMKYGEEPEDFAPRDLRRLVYKIMNDPDNDDRGLEYAVTRDLHTSDILEFGLFWDEEDEEDEDEEIDFIVREGDLLLTWDHTAPFVTLESATSGDRDGFAPLTYDINFLNADYTPSAGPETDDREGNSYLVAVRTSATWRSQLTLGVEVSNAEMIDPVTGEIPVDIDDDGTVEPIDDYSPNFFEDETLEAEAFYSASFGVYDPSGAEFVEGVLEVNQEIPTPNFWQHPNFLSINPAEFTRPRWNKPGQLMSIVFGEFFEKRRIIALEEWTSVIGINLHSTRGPNCAEEGAMLVNVNVVLTDVGADPYGPPGNGGFNPRDALKPVEHAGWDTGTYGRHVVHNGVWVWRDNNGNGLFEPPTPQAGGGVTFNNDRPLPSGVTFYEWEHIPLPPGGGDPWWRISLWHTAGEQSEWAFINGTPNNVFPDPSRRGKFGSEFTYDYFVVARFDSGHKDVSLRQQTSTGATYGAEFRAFIEPKRLDPLGQRYTGGIWTSSQIRGAFPEPEELDEIEFEFAKGMGPDDPRWMPNEPWWPERTLNAKVAKPFRVGVDVHDMVSTYSGRRDFLDITDVLGYQMFNFHPSNVISRQCGVGRDAFGHSPIGFRDFVMCRQMSAFAAWMDPLFQDARRFVNGHVVNAFALSGIKFSLNTSLFGQPYPMYAHWGLRQFAFEHTPFFKANFDLPPGGPRSSAYPTPPEQPAVPHYATWPGELQHGEYPALTDWDPEDARARLLTQKIEANSSHTPMLGINVAGSADPIVNMEGNSVTVAAITVAFWGPDFTPDLLKPLDPQGNANQSLDSGVLLWERSEEGTGLGIGLPLTFLNSQEMDAYADTPLPLLYDIVPVTGLRWSSAPEYVDLNGDGMPDDLSGDGKPDKAWVLTLTPRVQWEAPLNDILQNAGSDLYITVSTSEKLGRFQQFRAMVPAGLPSRAENRQKAGIQFFPPVNTSPKAFMKSNPEEDAVYGYYGHDMIQANIPVRIEDMTRRWSDIHIGGAPVPVLGLNMATNRKDGTVASGDSGVGYERSFHAPGQRWRPGDLKGDFLIDRRLESYEIIDNTADSLTLLSGTPRDGAWRVVRDPSFLEEVTVEFYQEGAHATFNPLTDLLPLDIDQRVSGVAIYRDNIHHPDNRPGVFDPDIDIPLTLDAPPRFAGRTADELKVRFVFASPGTSDFPKPRAEQPRNRQWVHDSFGEGMDDPMNGPDFFIVLRGSNEMQVGDNLRVGIVSWGPNTPTEPDPHIWANLPGEERHNYLKFREFPWAERGVGFITYFREPPVSYFLHGAKATQRPDSSGYNWIRSHSSQKRRSGVITARERPVGPNSLVIDSVSQRRLPIQTLPGEGFSFLIYGKNFGANPRVALSGYDVTVNNAKDDTISVTINTRPDKTPQEPVTLVVRNPVTGDEASRSDLFTLTSDVDVYGPKILRVNPSRGRKADFPVIIEGENFFGAPALEVRFGETRMPIVDVAADGTAIQVGFPAGGMPKTGPLNVLVATGGKTGGEDIKMDAFEYVNPESRPKVRFFGCGPRQDAGGGYMGDLALVGAVIAALMAARRRRGASA